MKNKKKIIFIVVKYMENQIFDMTKFAVFYHKRLTFINETLLTN